jgi:hypothetical protein
MSGPTATKIVNHRLVGKAKPFRLLNKSQLFKPGANTMIVSYNASVVKVYNATNGIARF